MPNVLCSKVRQECKIVQICAFGAYAHNRSLNELVQLSSWFRYIPFVRDKFSCTKTYSNTLAIL